MSKVICPCYECIHHSDKLDYCSSREIVLNEEWLHTVHQGFKHTWHCKLYEPKGKYTAIQQTIRRAIMEDSVREVQ